MCDNPFGPAGTGKTESVKALGTQLGRHVVVFCCDESFVYQAMLTIFVTMNPEYAGRSNLPDIVFKAAIQRSTMLNPDTRLIAQVL